MVQSPGCFVGFKDVQHQYRHLVGRLYHGRDVHRQTTVPGHDQRRPTSEDLSINGDPLRANLARHFPASRVQEQFPIICNAVIGNPPTTGRPAWSRSFEQTPPASTREPHQCPGSPHSSVVPRPTKLCRPGTCGGDYASARTACRPPECGRGLWDTVRFGEPRSILRMGAWMWSKVKYSPRVLHEQAGGCVCCDTLIHSIMIMRRREQVKNRNGTRGFKAGWKVGTGINERYVFAGLSRPMPMHSLAVSAGVLSR